MNNETMMNLFNLLFQYDTVFTDELGWKIVEMSAFDKGVRVRFRCSDIEEINKNDSVALLNIMDEFEVTEIFHGNDNITWDVIDIFTGYDSLRKLFNLYPGMFN